MKKLYLLILFFSIVSFAFAGPIITGIINNGKWKNNSTWDLNRKPKSGDTIVIPAGTTIIVSNNINLSAATIYLKVYGILKLNNGKLNLGANSVIILMPGATITSTPANNSNKILIGGVKKFLGSEVMVTGPSIANSGTGASPAGFRRTGTAPLPVKLVGFNVARQENNLIIAWITAQEFNSNYFEVQRSYDGIVWNTISTIKAAGFSSTLIKYSYTDFGVTATTLYYRIMEVDLDGRNEISDVRMIKLQDDKLDIKISNGYANKIYAHFSSQINGAVSVKLFSLSGSMVNETVLSNPVGQQIITVNQNLKGIFVVVIVDENGSKFSSQILL